MCAYRNVMASIHRGRVVCVRRQPAGSLQITDKPIGRYAAPARYPLIAQATNNTLP